MKKQNKILFTSLLGFSLLAAAIPAFASTSNNQASGGWSESEGYYVNNTSNSKSVSVMSSTSPDSHVGERRSRVASSGGDKYIWAWGQTYWFQVPHYTTAQIEKSNGTVLKSSGRIAENSNWYSTATSDEVYVELAVNYEARTYWGKR